MLPFASTPPKQNVVYNVEEVPKELDIFFKSEASFLPEGKDFKDLTPEEEKLLQSQYRFSPLKPGMYQTITGMSGKGRGGSM
jgi:hypothetical protein